MRSVARSVVNALLDIWRTGPVYEFFYPYNPINGVNERWYRGR